MLRDVKIYLTENCNMSCDYCFVDKSKKTSIPDEVLKKAIDFIGMNVTDSVDITFFGGEPLLEKDKIKMAVNYIASKKYKFKTNYLINTNLTLFDEEIADFFKQHEFVVLYSVDGIEETHNKHRKDLKGNGTFKAIIDKLQLLSSHSIKSVCKVVLTPETVGQAFDSITCLRDHGVKHVYLDLARQMVWDKEALECFALQYGKIANWLPYKGILITNLLRREQRGSNCGVGSRQLAITSDGNIYSCYRLVHEAFRLGNVYAGIDADKQRVFAEKVKKASEVCEGKIESKCAELCPAVNFEVNGDIEDKAKINCNFHRINEDTKKIYLKSILDTTKRKDSLLNEVR